MNPSYWHLPAARAVAALVVGLPIAFVEAHGALVGLWALVALTVLSGAAELWLGRLAPIAGRQHRINGVVGIAAGVVAAVLALVAPWLVSLVAVIVVWAIASGLVEGWAWMRVRAETDPRVHRIALDWRAVAALTLLLAIVIALSSDEVLTVGLLGAYCVIVGVFHAIAALSARPSKRAEKQAAGAQQNEEIA